MSTINDGDKFLVNRDNNSYQSEAKNYMAELQDNDLLLVNRGGTSYKINGSDLKTSLNPTKVPDIGSVVLTEDDPSGPRFTGQSFTSTVSMNEVGIPEASLGIKSSLEAVMIDRVSTGLITNVESQSAATANDNVTVTEPSYSGRTRTDTPTPYKLLFSKARNKFYMLSQYECFSSDDAINWTNLISMSRTGYDLFYEETLDQLVIAGDQEIHYSLDGGSSWTKVSGTNMQTYIDNSEWNGVTYNNGYWIFWYYYQSLNSSVQRNVVATPDITATSGWKAQTIFPRDNMARENSPITRGNGTTMVNTNINNSTGPLIGYESNTPWLNSSNYKTGFIYNFNQKAFNVDETISQAFNGSQAEFRTQGIKFGKGLFATQYDRSIWYSRDGVNWFVSYQKNLDLKEGSSCRIACANYGDGKWVNLSFDQNDFIISYDGIHYKQAEFGFSEVTKFGPQFGISSAYGQGCYGNGEYVFMVMASVDSGFTYKWNIIKSKTCGADETIITLADDTALGTLKLDDYVTSTDAIGAGYVARVDLDERKVYLRDVTGTFQAANQNKLTGPGRAFLSSAVTSCNQGQKKWLTQNLYNTLPSGSNVDARIGCQGPNTEVYFPYADSSVHQYYYLRTRSSSANIDDKYWDKWQTTELFGCSHINFIDGYYYIFGVRGGGGTNGGAVWKYSETDLINGVTMQPQQAIGTMNTRDFYSSAWDGNNTIAVVAKEYQGNSPYYYWRLWYSTDMGVNWSSVDGNQFSPTGEDVYPQFMRNISYGNGKWVMTGQPGIWYADSPGGTWSVANDFGFKYMADEMTVYGDERFIAATTSGEWITSNDAINWEYLPYDITSLDGEKIQVENNKTKLLYYNGVYVIVGQGLVDSSPYYLGLLITSRDFKNFDAPLQRYGTGLGHSWGTSFKGSTIGPMGLTMNYNQPNAKWLATSGCDTVGLSSCVVEFADSTNLDKFVQGAKVTVRDKPDHFGYIDKTNLTGNKIRIMDACFGTHKFCEPGDVLVSGPSETATTLQRYFKLSDDLTAFDITEDDPGFRLFTGTTPKISVVNVFGNGESPDEVLEDGTTIKTIVEADNLIGVSVKESNTVTPTGTTRGVGGFNSSDAADVTAFNSLQDSLDTFDDEKAAHRTAAADALRAANYSEDDITALGLQD